MRVEPRGRMAKKREFGGWIRRSRRASDPTLRARGPLVGRKGYTFPQSALALTPGCHVVVSRILGEPTLCIMLRLIRTKIRQLEPD